MTADPGGSAEPRHPVEPLAQSPKHAAGRDRGGRAGDRPAGPLDLLNSMASIIVVALFVLTFVVQSYQIPTGSMQNTLLVGDFLLVDKLVYSPAGFFHTLLPYGEPRDGAIIIFHHSVDPGLLLVKRVIGEPGDRIHLRDGVVFRNGAPVSEPYAIHQMNAAQNLYRDNFPQGAQADERVRNDWASQLAGETHGGDLVVPPDEFFVLGDNRDQSLDSRYWGLVPRENIVGCPLFLYFARAVLPAHDDKLAHGREPSSTRFRRFDRIFRIIH